MRPTVARSDAETIAGVIGWPSAIRYVERDQLDGLDHAHPGGLPPMAEVVENHVCADGKCKTD